MSFTPAAQVPHIQFDSRSMPAPQALDYWRDSLSRSWEVSLADEVEPSDFHAEVSCWRIHDLIVGTAAFGPKQMRMRREGNIRSDQLDHYRILLNRQGHFDCDADGQQISLAPGRFLITDLGRPEWSQSACRTAVLYIPRDLLDEALPQPMRLHGLSPRNACAEILSEHLSSLLDSLPRATPEELAGLSCATVSLVAASLALTAQNREGAQPAIDSAMFRRARRYVEEHLTEDDLGAQQLCSALRVSRSTLYRLFEPIGGVAQYIKERRLARVHEVLSRSRERPHIARLAERHGFKSAAHFSKAFRTQFGYSAREVPRCGAPATPTIQPRGESLGDWLGSLHP
jgi:AraC-like DNA-binding protein